jgi:riboflavin biosynthesis pyrimidine reductase
MRQLFPTAGDVGPADEALFATLRSLADVVLVGAGTMRAEGYGPARLSDDARARRRDWGLPPVQPIAVITRSCRLDWSARFFTEAEQRPLVVTVASAAAAGRARAAEAADMVIAGDDDVDLARAVSDGAALAPPSVLELGHVLEADGYLFLHYRRR